MPSFEKNLEYRMRDLRETIMGKNLSEKYSFRLSEDGTIEQGTLSNFDSIKFILRGIGKLMIPYTGDILLKKWNELESEINPTKKDYFNFCRLGITVTKYIFFGTLSNTLLEKFI